MNTWSELFIENGLDLDKYKNNEYHIAFWNGITLLSIAAWLGTICIIKVLIQDEIVDYALIIVSMLIWLALMVFASNKSDGYKDLNSKRLFTLFSDHIRPSIEQTQKEWNAWKARQWLTQQDTDIINKYNDIASQMSIAFDEHHLNLYAMAPHTVIQDVMRKSHVNL